MVNGHAVVPRGETAQEPSQCNFPSETKDQCKVEEVRCVHAELWLVSAWSSQGRDVASEKLGKGEVKEPGGRNKADLNEAGEDNKAGRSSGGWLFESLTDISPSRLFGVQW